MIDGPIRRARAPFHPAARATLQPGTMAGKGKSAPARRDGTDHASASVTSYSCWFCIMYNMYTEMCT